MNTKDYLNEEIARVYEVMGKLDPDTEEYGKLEARWTELMDRKIEIEKSETQAKENRKDRFWRNVSDVFKVALPLGVSVGMTFMLTAAEAKGVMPYGFGKKWVDKITKQ